LYKDNKYLDEYERSWSWSIRRLFRRHRSIGIVLRAMGRGIGHFCVWNDLALIFIDIGPNKPKHGGPKPVLGYDWNRLLLIASINGDLSYLTGCLSHETIHIVLDRLGVRSMIGDASAALDNLPGWVFNSAGIPDIVMGLLNQIKISEFLGSGEVEPVTRESLTRYALGDDLNVLG